MEFFTKVIVSALIIAGVSELAKRFTLFAAILAAVLFSLNFLGDGLRDALDPRSLHD